jgi:hypothetical protein
MIGMKMASYMWLWESIFHTKTNMHFMLPAGCECCRGCVACGGADGAAGSGTGGIRGAVFAVAQLLVGPC